MNQTQFLEKQSEIYNRLKDTRKIRAEGTEPRSLPQGGYLIMFRHSLDTAVAVERFSRRIACVVPSIAYDAETVHTSISDYMLSDDFKVDKEILEKLGRAANSIKNQPSPVIEYSSADYPNWLYNQNSVIIPGIPDGQFLGLTKMVVDGAKQEGMELRLPWGAHITTNRFTQKTSPNELKDFFKLMNKAPRLGTSFPIFIDVGYFNFSPAGFIIEVAKDLRVKLR